MKEEKKDKTKVPLPRRKIFATSWQNFYRSSLQCIFYYSKLFRNCFNLQIFNAWCYFSRIALNLYLDL